MRTAWQVAVVGAGPVGLALALHAQRLLPHAQITLFDARPLDRDVSADPRTLALSLGSVQFLQRLGVWPAAAAQVITEVQVSQQPPSMAGAEVHLLAHELGVPLLGAVLPYGRLLAPLQQAWLDAAARQPDRLHTRLGTPVAAIKPLADGVEVDAGIAERFDLAVLAEGGIYTDQVRKGLHTDYGQTAWVGNVSLEGATPGRAFERFTRYGPAALLPLPPSLAGEQPQGVPGPGPDTARAALVWCVPTQDDPVRDLDEGQRLAVLASIFPPAAGRLAALSSLKPFALGLNAERTLVEGRTVRIGNAAQTLHPVAGQGLNLGLRDVHELVGLLRWATDLDSALQRAEWARAADRWTMIAATDFLARSFTWGLPGAAWARGLGLLALQSAPPAKAWLARRMMFGAR
jgi:2-octaprenyl-6-methoxyphenol hydroxylase